MSKPTPIQGADKPMEQAPTQAVDRLDSAYSVDFEKVGRPAAPAPVPPPGTSWQVPGEVPPRRVD